MTTNYAAAPCAGDLSEIWFSRRTSEQEQAKQKCGGCTMRQVCLDEQMAHEAGMDVHHRAGVFGGLTAKQRVSLRRQIAAAEREAAA